MAKSRPIQDAADPLIRWMDDLRLADIDAFVVGDFLTAYWDDARQRTVLARMADELLRLRKIVIDLEADIAAMRIRHRFVRGVNAASVIGVAAHDAGLPVAAMRSHDSNYRVVTARQVAAYVAVRLCRLTLDQVAEQLIRYDAHDVRRMVDLAEVRRSNPEFRAAVESVLGGVRAIHG